jgi:hypothetical protein
MKQLLTSLLIFVVYLLSGTQASYAAGHQDYYPRPIPMGVSISTTPTSPYISAGTAGMRVYALANPNIKLILSNNHVLGSIGPSLCPDTADLWPPPLTRVIQPGTLDIGSDPGNDPFYVTAGVVKTVPLRFGLLQTNLVDAAVALTTTDLASTDILGIGSPTPELGTAIVGMDITKSGRTTGVTTGKVTAVNATVLVNYGTGCGTAVFKNQIMTTASLGDSGDSGSVVLESSTLKPVGLYFAGSALQGIMNPILQVYQSLGVFVDSDTAAPALSQQQFAARSQSISPDPRLKLLREIQARHQMKLLGRIAGLTGMGISRDGQQDAFVIYARKRTAALMNQLPNSIEGVPVRVVESGEFRPY